MVVVVVAAAVVVVAAVAGMLSVILVQPPFLWAEESMSATFRGRSSKYHQSIEAGHSCLEFAYRYLPKNR